MRRKFLISATIPNMFNHPSTGYCSSNPPPAIVQPALHRLLFNLPSTGSCSSSRPRDPVHPRATGSTDRGPVHLVATPRGPFHPTPTGNCTSKPHNNAHCSSRGNIVRLQLAAVAKESLDRSGSVTSNLQCNRSGSVRRMPRSGSVRAQCLTPTRVRF